MFGSYYSSRVLASSKAGNSIESTGAFLFGGLAAFGDSALDPSKGTIGIWLTAVVGS